MGLKQISHSYLACAGGTLQDQSLVKSCTIGFRVTLNPCQRVVDRGYNCISHDGLTWILPYPPQT